MLLTTFGCCEITVSSSCRGCHIKRLLLKMTLVAEKGIHSLNSRHSNIFQRMRAGEKDYRLLPSFLPLQLEHVFIVCFHNTAFALQVDFYFEVSLFQLAKILPTTTTENDVISKQSLFLRVDGFSVPHRCDFSMSLSAIGGLCSVCISATPCFFSSTHCAP